LGVGWGGGGWAPKPQPPNPQSPIPNPQFQCFLKNLLLNLISNITFENILKLNRILIKLIATIIYINIVSIIIYGDSVEVAFTFDKKLISMSYLFLFSFFI